MFQIKPNLAYLAYVKAKWQPCDKVLAKKREREVEGEE